MGHSSKYPVKGICKVYLQGKHKQEPYRLLKDGERYFVTYIDHYTYFSLC